LLADQYDSFAADYHWLYSDRVLSGDPFIEENRAHLDGLPADAAILDCACGIGVHALALARHGFSVQGTDASPGMVRQAAGRAEHESVGIRYQPVSWEDLPSSFGRQFDVAFCCGNSIGHCRDNAELVSSLKGIRGVLRDKGLLVLDSRNWDKLRHDKPRFNTMQLRVRDGIRCVPLYVWNFPSTCHEQHMIEVVFILETEGRISHRSYQITYFPFSHEQVVRGLRQAGFADVDSDYDPTKDMYTLRARRG